MSDEIEQAIEQAKQSFSVDPNFQVLLEYAKGIAVLNGHAEVLPEHLAVGAWLATQDGALKDAAVLADHVMQYEPEMKKFLVESQWRLGGVTRCAEAFAMSAAAIQAMVVSSKLGSPLQSLLNLSLQAINRIAAAENVAYHELGHALVSLVLRPEIRINEITIQPADPAMGAAGYVAYDPTSMGFNPTSREDVIEQISISLAGRAAQIRKFGADAADAGASHDMQTATETALHAVTLLGLDQEFGPINLEVVAKFMGRLTLSPNIPDALATKLVQLTEQGGLSQEEMSFIVGKMAQGNSAPFPQGYLFDEAQRAAQKMIKEAYARATDILDKHWGAVESAVGILMQEKTLSEAQLREALGINLGQMAA